METPVAVQDLGIRADYFISMAGGNVTVERDRYLGILEGRIVQVSAFRTGDESLAKEFRDLPGRVVLPGLINAHTHLPMTLLRGIDDDVDLHQWLFSRIFPLEAEFMDVANVTLGTKLAALECARFGVTTVSDMYFHTRPIVQTWRESGLRGVFSQTFIDLPTPEDAFIGDRETHYRNLVGEFAGDNRVRLAVAAHAPYSCSDATLRQVNRVAEETGTALQIHLHETEREVEDGIRDHGERPAARLSRLGFLRRETLLHHGVHLNSADRAQIAAAGASVVHNPDSNMKLGSGVAPLRELIDAGVNIALGTDGAASSNSLCLLSAMNIGAKLQKVSAGRTDVIRAAELLRMATWGGAGALGWQTEIGSLEVGKWADLIAIDLEQPHLQPVNDVVSHLVYSARGQDVELTVVGGRICLDNRVTKLPWTLGELRPALEKIRAAVRKSIEALKLSAT